MTAVQSRRPKAFPYCPSWHRFQQEAGPGGGVFRRTQRIQELQQQTELKGAESGRSQSQMAFHFVSLRFHLNSSCLWSSPAVRRKDPAARRRCPSLPSAVRQSFILVS